MRQLASSLCFSLSLLLAFSHHQQCFQITWKTCFLAVTVSLSLTLFLPPLTHCFFLIFSELCCFPASWSSCLLFPPFSLSLSFSLLCQSTGGTCRADALAPAQEVADFITMAALYHHRSHLLLLWPVPCYLVLLQLACVETSIKSCHWKGNLQGLPPFDFHWRRNATSLKCYKTLFNFNLAFIQKSKYVYVCRHWFKYFKAFSCNLSAVIL